MAGIVRLNELPEGSGSLSNDDIFVFMDDPNGGSVTKKISLSEISAATGGGGLSDSDRYIICKAGDDIAAKYASAKLLTPGGNALSSTNRAYLIIMPGVYPLAEQWEIDGEFVDIIGLGSSSLDRGCNVAVTVTDYDINVSANDVKLKGIGTTTDHALKVDGDKPLQVFEECKSGGFSFGAFSAGTASGTFTNCSGGNYSFGGAFYSGTASGTFTNCSGGDGSFGGGLMNGGTASGIFTNCSGGTGSFGGISLGGSSGTAIGSFKDCSGGNYSFGGGGTASGVFKDCSGGDYSFGFGGTASGSFKDCSGGLHSFGGWGIASGTFTNCSAGNSGFGGTGMAPGTASGKFLSCTLTSGSFPSLTYPGIQRLCIDGSYNVINSDAPTP